MRQIGNRLAPHPILARHDRADGFQQNLRGRLFHHHATRADLQGLGHLAVFDRGGQKDHPHLGALSRQFPQGFQPWHARHCQIQQKNVGADLLSLGDGLGAIGGFAHHLEFRLRFQETAQAVAKDRMIVGD